MKLRKYVGSWCLKMSIASNDFQVSEFKRNIVLLGHRVGRSDLEDFPPGRCQEEEGRGGNTVAT